MVIKTDHVCHSMIDMESSVGSVLELWDALSRERFSHIKADYVFTNVKDFEKFIKEKI